MESPNAEFRDSDFGSRLELEHQLNDQYKCMRDLLKVYGLGVTAAAEDNNNKGTAEQFHALP